MKKGIALTTPSKKRAVAKARKYVVTMMKVNKLSHARTAKMFRIHRNVLQRLIDGRLTYVPHFVEVAMLKAKEKSERAYYRQPEELFVAIEKNNLIPVRDEVKRIYEYLNNLVGAESK